MVVTACLIKHRIKAIKLGAKSFCQTIPLKKCVLLNIDQLNNFKQTGKLYE
jgi:hypothetical protein